MIPNFSPKLPPDFNQLELPEFDFQPLDYEDTFLKDMAEDIKKSQQETTDKIDSFIENSKKSDSFNRKITLSTLIIAVLTLFATITGIIVSLL